MIKLDDPLKDKKPKKWEVEVEVDEVGPGGLPTGRKVKVPEMGALARTYKDREDWLAKRLTEIGATPGDHGVRVLRGSDDDVMGIQYD